MVEDNYHLANIRTLLIRGFDDEELRELCFDVPGFRPVYDKLATNTGKATIVAKLLEYADRTLQIDTLLELAKARNPARYEKHQPYYRAEAADLYQPPPTTHIPPSLQDNSDSSLLPRVFLCHADEDKPEVQVLYHQLKDAGYHPWLDKYDLLPGQVWRREIRKIITNPYNLIVICLSNKSITKRGVVQQEIKWALDVLDQMPEGAIYLIPARLEPCEVPDRLSNLHWVNLFEPDGFEKLRKALDFEISKQQGAPQIISMPVGPGDYSTTTETHPASETPTPPSVYLPQDKPPRNKKFLDYFRDPLWQGVSVLIAVIALGWGVYTFFYANPSSTSLSSPTGAIASAVATPSPNCEAGIAPSLEELDKMVFIPDTNFIMGDNQGQRDKHLVEVSAFLIDRFEITNFQYRDFISATGRESPPEWDGLNFPDGQRSFQPVINVSWEDARDYCEWASKRLPTEAEWELACRGPEGWLYPWGEDPDHRANTLENACGQSLTVGSHSPSSDSGFGVSDMAGNVLEWVNSLHQPYPYQYDDGRENLSDTQSPRVVRGGSWQVKQEQGSCAIRSPAPPAVYSVGLGFRCARGASPP